MFSQITNESHHDKSVRPVWSESSLCAQWVAKGPRFLHADSEDSDQTGRMPRLIWVFAGRTLILLVLSCCGSHYQYMHLCSLLYALVLFAFKLVIVHKSWDFIIYNIVPQQGNYILECIIEFLVSVSNIVNVLQFCAVSVSNCCSGSILSEM